MMNTTETLSQSQLLMEAGEPFAAGLCECPEATPFERYARAYRRWFEDGPIAAYEGGQLYPGGPKPATSATVAPNYSSTLAWNRRAFDERLPQLDAPTREAFDDLNRLLKEEGEKI